MAGYSTFYVDPDDEVPAFVSRMNSTEASFVVFVVPQRALLFASAITLRLLKKESDRLEKDIVLISQDEQGIDMAKRAGFMVRRTLEELPFMSSETKREATQNARRNMSPSPMEMHKSAESDASRVTARAVVSQKPESENDGSTNEGVSIPQTKPPQAESSHVEAGDEASPPASSKRSMADSLAGVVGQSQRTLSPSPEVRQPASPSENEIGSSVWNDAPTSAHVEKQKHVSASTPMSVARAQNMPAQTWDVKGVKKGKGVSSAKPAEGPTQAMRMQKSSSKKTSAQTRNEPVGSRAQWLVAIGFLIVLGMIGVVGVSLSAPEATVVVYPKKETVSGDASATAQVSGGEVEARFFDAEEMVTVNVPATGSVGGVGSKAKGKVVLYNTFSTEAQPLVATTRLESPEGKIFRITKSLTIPGYTFEEGAIKPGTIEVEVQADEGGESYNIGPSKFTVPGFSSSEKREKIYAESTAPMAGGGLAESKERTVSESDVSTAQKQATDRIIGEILSGRAQNALSSGVSAPDLIEVTILEKTSTPSVGIVAENVQVEMKARVRYAVFSDDDARVVGVRTLTALAGGDVALESIDYGKTTVDFDAETVDIKMFVSGMRTADIPLEDIKRDILGKDQSELQTVIDAYSQVQGFEVKLDNSSFGGSALPSRSDKVRVELGEKQET